MTDPRNDPGIIQGPNGPQWSNPNIGSSPFGKAVLVLSKYEGRTTGTATERELYDTLYAVVEENHRRNVEEADKAFFHLPWLFKKLVLWIRSRGQ